MTYRLLQFGLFLFSIALPSFCIAAPSHEVFLKTYCIKCHGAEEQKSDRRFDQLSGTIKTLQDLEQWQDILDQVNLGDMPPEDGPQPSKEEVVAIVQGITAKIRTAQEELNQSGRHTVLRRLNAFEYQQTIGDLLGLNVEALNPAADFPSDVKVNSFDNNGKELVTSGMLLAHYLAAAEIVIKRATFFEEKPESKFYAQKSPYYFAGKNNSDLPKLFQVDRFRYIPEVPYTDLYGRHYRGGHIGFVPLARGGVPVSGYYTVRVQAAAIDRVHNYGKGIDDFRNGDPLVLELLAVNRVGSVESTGSISAERSLASVELTSETPQWLEWNCYIEKGYEPEVRFRNGTLATKRLIRILTGVADDHPELLPFKDMKPGLDKSHGMLKVFKGPKLRIWEVQVEGPHIKSWPPVGHKLMYGNLRPEELNRENIVQRLHIFAESAYRRPLKPNELAPIESLVNRKLDSNMNSLAALQLGFQTILCSPSFLYMNEAEGPLSQYAMATRLSYFLWSSMPDDELLQLAQAEKLSDISVLRQQVTRMLADSKAKRFVDNFVHHWLDFDNIGEMPPSEDFRVYYRDNLEAAMRSEAIQFFEHLLSNNLSTREFLAADYTFLNRELALHYGLEGIEGNEMRKVAVSEINRGGLLSQGSFLTASANGVDTSPVVRGIYVLEKILGYTPPPPPEDVPAIEPDIRGALTIREQLTKHRQVATCAECHRKIDPIGFAFENYDPIGGWRNEYGKNLPIDASGQLPSGEQFTDASELKTLLIERESQFTRCLTEKMLTYALGRELEIGDRPSIDHILDELNSKGNGLQDLIQLIVASDSFQSN